MQLNEICISMTECSRLIETMHSKIKQSSEQLHVSTLQHVSNFMYPKVNLGFHVKTERPVHRRTVGSYELWRQCCSF